MLSLLRRIEAELENMAIHKIRVVDKPIDFGGDRVYKIKVWTQWRECYHFSYKLEDIKYHEDPEASIALGVKRDIIAIRKDMGARN